MYFILPIVAKRIYARITNLTWDIVLILTFGHYLISWGLFDAIGGEKISSGEIFWYFYATTATTVGYGDYSPVTEAGRLVVVLWIMPGGIALFTTIIAKVVRHISERWRKRMRGLSSYENLSGHIVILGWHGTKTQRMVDHIRGDKDGKDREIVLCTAKNVENPMPDQVHFVRGATLNTPDILTRAGVKTAEHIIALGNDDNETLAAALGAAAINYDAHMVAYFDQQSFADLLKAHCSQAECNVSLSIEMMVRSAQDPGSSRVQRQLLSTLEGPTQFSLNVPENINAVNYGALFSELKNSHDATLFGVAKSTLGDDLILNAPSDFQVDPGTILYFMAARRIGPSDINWSGLTSQ
ncbi:MAG TPA: potassium channel protein [Rhodospirillales bacterium]|nr:potassium channel protein [Rhodospirillales bacterium]